MRKRLTDDYVRKVKPPAKGRLEVADSEVPGLQLRVTAAGARSWRIRYRVKGLPGRRSDIPGPYPTVTLADARQRAREIVAAAKRGVDLVELERQQIAQRAVAAASADSVASVAQEFIRRSLEGRKRAPSYIADTRRIFEAFVLPRWGTRDIRTITRPEVVALLDGVVDDGKPVQANRVLAAVRAMFNWAVRRGILDASPAALVERPTREKARERFLSAEEIKAVWPEFDALGYPFGPFFQVALLTGQRREEVAEMRWADVDAADRTWSLTSDQTKPDRAHVVPLSPLAWSILMEAKEAAVAIGGSLAPYVFTTTGDRPISGFSKSKAQLDAIVAKARAEAGLAPLQPWRIHDLRRTCGSGLGKVGTPRFIIGRVLNHADNSVTGIYDRHEYLAEKREALERWAIYVSNLTAPAGGNVVPLRG
jgi:integrase